jgi:threonyl-tRNA synthetase
MPAWLAPVQVVVCNVSENQAEYVTEVVQALKNKDLGLKADLRNEKISYKIREHSVQKLPYYPGCRGQGEARHVSCRAWSRGRGSGGDAPG